MSENLHTRILRILFRAGTPVATTGKAADELVAEIEEPHPVVELDAVNHPRHYTAHPSGVECIQITEHMGFCLGNAVKYIWRADEKGRAVEDLRKARWYLDREIARRIGA